MTAVGGMRSRLVAPLLGVALVAAGWAAPSASAQEEQQSSARVVLRAVDATDSDEVTLFVGASEGLDGIEVRENGDAVDAEVIGIDEAGFRHDIVLLFDTSASTDPNALLATAKEAASALLEDLPAGTRVAVMFAGGAAQVVQGLTDDAGEAIAEIDDLTPNGEGALLGGLVRAANVASNEGSIPSVVLFTDGVEDTTTPFDLARGTLVDQGAALYVVGLQDGELDEGAFGNLVSASGGRMVVASEAGAIDGLVADLAPELFGLGAVRYASEADEGVQDLVVAAGGARTEGSYIAGSTLIGARRVAPRPAVEPAGVSFLRGDLGRVLGFGAAALACMLFAYGAILLVTREPTALSQALRPYADGYVAEGDDDEGSGGITQTAFLQRAVQVTEQFAERRGVLAKLEASLERADLPLRAGEALFFYLAGLGLVLVALLVLSQNLLATIVVGGIVGLVPIAALNILASRKRKQFEALLPDTLQLLSSTLRAGYSMMQGVEAVSVEAADPMGKELRRVVTEARLGRPLEESLDGIADRMGSPDFAWAVMAIRIQREVGGNLSELLMTVAETMTQRERLRRDISALTAEGRISAYVLLALPIGLGLFLWSVNPDYVGRLFDVTLGQFMLGASVVAMGAGYAWMMKIIKIEI